MLNKQKLLKNIKSINHIYYLGNLWVSCNFTLLEAGTLRVTEIWILPIGLRSGGLEDDTNWKWGLGE